MQFIHDHQFLAALAYLALVGAMLAGFAYALSRAVNEPMRRDVPAPLHSGEDIH